MKSRALAVRLYLGIFVLGLLAATNNLKAQDSPKSVTFSNRVSQLGDQLEQTLSVESDLKIRKRQAQEILEEEQRKSGRHQQRIVTVRAKEGDQVIEADAHFLESSEHYQSQKANDPVVGKTYRCKVDNDKLTILTESGEIPPIQEYRVVARAMETLGKPNPIANFLVGKQVSIGDTLTLPNEIAQKAFGLEKKLGEVETFTLTLLSIETTGQGPVANFKASIEAAGNGSSQMRLYLDGKVAIDSATSQVVFADLSGPIGMLESRGSYGNNYLVDGTGRMHLQISSECRLVR